MSETEEQRTVHPLMDVTHAFLHASEFMQDAVEAADAAVGDDGPDAHELAQRAGLLAQAATYKACAVSLIHAMQDVETYQDVPMPSMKIGTDHVMTIGALFCTAGGSVMPEENGPCLHGETIAGDFPVCRSGMIRATTLADGITDPDGPFRPLALATVADASRFTMVKQVLGGEMGDPHPLQYQADGEAEARLAVLSCYVHGAKLGEEGLCAHGEHVTHGKACELGYATAEVLLDQMGPEGHLNAAFTYMLAGGRIKPTCDCPNCAEKKNNADD